MHSNERLLRREYDARARRDDASLAAILTDDVVWHGQEAGRWANAG
jgi:ketosteroid isomerase-like protein